MHGRHGAGRRDHSDEIEHATASSVRGAPRRRRFGDTSASSRRTIAGDASFPCSGSESFATTRTAPPPTPRVLTKPTMTDAVEPALIAPSHRSPGPRPGQGAGAARPGGDRPARAQGRRRGRARRPAQDGRQADADLQRLPRSGPDPDRRRDPRERRRGDRPAGPRPPGRRRRRPRSVVAGADEPAADAVRKSGRSRGCSPACRWSSATGSGSTSSASARPTSRSRGRPPPARSCSPPHTVLEFGGRRSPEPLPARPRELPPVRLRGRRRPEAGAEPGPRDRRAAACSSPRSSSGWGSRRRRGSCSTARPAAARR